MTYFLNTTCKRRPARAKSLGDFADEMNKLNRLAFGPSEEIQCLDQANAKVAPLDARVLDLAANWNPTGFYTPDEMTTVVNETVKILSQAAGSVINAPTSTSDAVAGKNSALKAIVSKTEQRVSYNAAVQEARAKGLRAINAPGLKEWVISSMRAASHGLVTAAVLECRMDWLASAIIAYTRVFDAAASIIRRVVGVVIKIGELALDVAEEVPDLAKKLLFVAKWGAVAFAAAFVVKKIKEAR